MVLFVPQVRYLGTLISFHRYPGPLDTKNMEQIGKNEEILIFQETYVGLGELEKC